MYQVLKGMVDFFQLLFVGSLDILSEVQRHINIINQREAFADDDATRLMVNEAMQDITFNFSKIGEEELKMLSLIHI